MRKLIILMLLALIVVPSAMAFYSYYTIDDRGKYWGQNGGLTYAGACGITPYGGPQPIEYFNCTSNFYNSTDDLVWSYSHRPIHFWYDTCTSNNEVNIGSSGFYAAYPARFHNESFRTEVTCVEDFGSNNINSSNTSWTLYNRFLANVSIENATWGEETDFNYSIAQYIGTSALGLYYTTNIYFINSTGATVYTKQSNKTVLWSCSNNINLAAWCDFTMTISSNQTGADYINWSNIPNTDEVYNISVEIWTRDYNDQVTLTIHSETEDDFLNVSEYWICGDNIIGGPEVCDGTNLSGTTCGNFSYASGTLGCLANCSGYDVSPCYTCGNIIVEGPEVCDGTNLSSQTCVSQGFSSGTISCLGTCLLFNTALCVSAGGGGGGSFPEPPPPLAVIPPTVEEEELTILPEFGKLFERLSLAFEILIAEPLEALTIIWDSTQEFTYEWILLILILIAIIFLGIKRPWEKKKKNRRKKK